MKVPDEDGRLDLLQMYTRGMPLDDVDLERIAKDTENFLEPDLDAVVKKAALNALFRSIPPGSLDKPLPDSMVNKIRVSIEDFSAALEDAYKLKSESFNKLVDPRKGSKGFDVDKQRYSESITEIKESKI
jgi:transitional endoplasmic reticulum ATPase